MARIAIFLANLPMGGAERVLLALAGGLAKRGHDVELALVQRRGAMAEQIPPGVRVVELGTTTRWALVASFARLPAPARGALLAALVRAKPPKVYRSLPRLARHLAATRPDALLTSLPLNNLTALFAAHLAAAPTRIVVREAIQQSSELAGETRAFERLFPALARAFYPQAAAIVAVSNGVADDLARLAAIPRERVTAIHNPVDLERVARDAAAPAGDAWLDAKDAPVLVAAGRLVPQKDFATLLRAFARVRDARAARLVVLGDGPLRAELEALARDLGVADAVRFAGAVANPFAWFARADLFVLSSAWEGFPNALLEALACGCPVVSTDCPSGPAELLDGGRHGRLVPVGDADALAAAIEAALAAPPDRAAARRRAADFAIDRVLDRYERALLGEDVAGRDGARYAAGPDRARGADAGASER